MTPVYQITGALRGVNGDCFQACLASVFDRKLNTVPNFMEGTGNGKLLPEAVKAQINSWLGQYHARYFELGYTMSLPGLLAAMGHEMPNVHYLLTGRNKMYQVHTVVCRGSTIVHDPATSPGNHTIEGPCHDGYFRIGVFVLDR